MNTVLLPRESVMLESIWQYRMPFSPPNWVGQHPIHPDIVSKRHQAHARNRRGPQRVALRQVTAEAIVNGSVWCVFVHFDGPEVASDSAPLITRR
jgi:hypothetical protein